MITYSLEIAAELDQMIDLQPVHGCDHRNFPFVFTVKCLGCGEISKRGIVVMQKETVRCKQAKGCTHFSQKCMFCERQGYIRMVSGHSRPLIHADSQAEKFVPLMRFVSVGYEMEDFVFGPGWKA